MICAIYKITNSVNDKVYIGSASDVDKRFYNHKYHLNRKSHANRHLQSAWNKDGKANFYFSLIEICNEENRIEREQFWIDKYKSYKALLGYNICEIAGVTTGYKHTEASLIKMKANGVGFKGKTWSKEHREKYLAKVKGKPKSEEHKEKIRQIRIGTKSSEQAKLKISLKTKGNKNPNRNLLKWPHVSGKKCKCEECIKKKRKMKNDYNRMWRNS